MEATDNTKTRVKGFYQKETWGSIGEDGLAGRLAWENADRKFKLGDPISCLAVGTHQTTPATLKEGNRLTLRAYMKVLREEASPEESLVKGLPFIFQVLSVRVPTPITCHPDKEEIKNLRKSCPKQFPNRTIKEVMLISIGHSLMAIGIRPIPKIKKLLKKVPELTYIIPEGVFTKFIYNKRDTNVGELIHFVFDSSPLKRSLAIEVILSRLIGTVFAILFTRRRGTGGFKDEHAFEYYLFMKMQIIYPYDVGVFLPFFFNCTLLGPGEALHVPAGTPYSLLFGDYVSVSTRSTNEATVGMSAVYRNPDVLLSAVCIWGCEAGSYKVPGAPVDQCTYQYRPDNSELVIYRISVPEDLVYSLPSLDCPSVLQITRGSILTSHFKLLKFASIIFIPANEEFSFKAKEDSTMYRAYAEM